MWHLLEEGGDANAPRGGYEIRDDHGQPGRIDIAYPQAQLAIECDGYEHHGTREAFEARSAAHDAARGAGLARLPGHLEAAR